MFFHHSYPTNAKVYFSFIKFKVNAHTKNKLLDVMWLRMWFKIQENFFFCFLAFSLKKHKSLMFFFSISMWKGKKKVINKNFSRRRKIFRFFCSIFIFWFKGNGFKKLAEDWFCIKSYYYFLWTKSKQN